MAALVQISSGWLVVESAFCNWRLLSQDSHSEVRTSGVDWQRDDENDEKERKE